MKIIQTIAIIVLSFVTTALGQNTTSPAAKKQKVEVRIDLSTQMLFVLSASEQRAQTLFQCPISSGKIGYETPTGRVQIIEKEKIHKGHEYPCDLPWAMRLSFSEGGKNRGIFLHEGIVRVENYAIMPASHRCLRIGKGDAETVFSLCPEKTEVEIVGTISEYIRNKVDGYHLLEITKDNSLSFKRNKDGTLTKEFIEAVQQGILQVCKIPPDREQGETEDRSKWVIGFMFLDRRTQCVPVSEYERQTGDRVYAIQPKKRR